LRRTPQGGIDLDPPDVTEYAPVTNGNSPQILRVLARQLEQAMQEEQKTKRAIAKQLHTNRSQLDRLLDPRNISVTLDTMTRAARAPGKRVIIRIADVKAKRA